MFQFLCLYSVYATFSGNEWYNGNADHFVATAEYDFDGEGEGELSFRRGQHIIIAPKGQPH